MLGRDLSATRLVSEDKVETQRGDLGRFALVTMTLVLLAIAALEGWYLFSNITTPDVTLGLDYRIYMERTHSWLAGDGFYQAHQLAGPYTVTEHPRPAFYPPVLLYLTVPFTVLPAVLWWAIPLSIIGYCLWRLRPPMWTWPILALVLVYPRTWMVLAYGNPSLWVYAALMAGLVWTFPAPWVMLKPTFAPFALLGIRRRRWWLGAGIGLLLAIPFGAMWLDYLTILRNAQNDEGLIYLIGEWPIAAGLAVAGLASVKRDVLLLLAIIALVIAAGAFLLWVPMPYPA